MCECPTRAHLPVLQLRLTIGMLQRESTAHFAVLRNMLARSYAAVQAPPGSPLLNSAIRPYSARNSSHDLHVGSKQYGAAILPVGSLAGMRGAG